MKTILAITILCLPLGAQALLIDGPSDSIIFSGSAADPLLEVVDGADVGVSMFGRSIFVTGFDSAANISGGNLQGQFAVAGFDAMIDISGGTIAGGLSLGGFDSVTTITGGSFMNEIVLGGFGTTLNIFGRNLAVANGNLMGTLADGSAIDVALVLSGFDTVLNIQSVSVPEPSALALLGFGLLGLRFARKRK